MTRIKFANDYGYHPAAPFWLVYADESPTVQRVVQTEPTREAAETAAARLALAFPGHEFHACCVMSTISTSPRIVGQRFDPTRTPPREPEAADFAEVDPPQCDEPAPQPEDSETPL